MATKIRIAERMTDLPFYKTPDPAIYQPTSARRTGHRSNDISPTARTAGGTAVGQKGRGDEASFWAGFGAPRNTPAEIVGKLNKEINAALEGRAGSPPARRAFYAANAAEASTTSRSEIDTLSRPGTAQAFGTANRR